MPFSRAMRARSSYSYFILVAPCPSDTFFRTSPYPAATVSSLRDRPQPAQENMPYLYLLDPPVVKGPERAGNCLAEKKKAYRSSSEKPYAFMAHMTRAGQHVKNAHPFRTLQRPCPASCRTL